MEPLINVSWAAFLFVAVCLLWLAFSFCLQREPSRVPTCRLKAFGPTCTVTCVPNMLSLLSERQIPSWLNALLVRVGLRNRTVLLLVAPLRREKVFLICSTLWLPSVLLVSVQDGLSHKLRLQTFTGFPGCICVFPQECSRETFQETQWIGP